MPPADPRAAFATVSGRLRATTCAAAALLLAVATPALAQWREGGRDGGRGGRGEAYQDRGDRGRRGGGDWGGGRVRGDGGFGGDGRGAGRRLEGQGSGQRGYGPQTYGARRGGGDFGDRGGGYGFQARPGPAANPRAWRRGEVLPDGFRSATVPDPGRYHLRRAPNGYDWVGDNRNAYLMQRSTGMVLDSVPGAYEPPPPYQGRRRR